MMVGVEWLNDFIGTNSVTFHFLLVIYSDYRSMKTSLIFYHTFTYDDTEHLNSSNLLMNVSAACSLINDNRVHSWTMVILKCTVLTNVPHRLFNSFTQPFESPG
jgi:hypothetical protein